MEKKKETINFTDTDKVIKWNRRLLGIIGLWPSEVRDFIFVPCFVYVSLYSLSGFLDLIDYFSDFDHLLTNIVENLLVVMTVAKIAICRIKKQTFLQFLLETESDYHVASYKNDQEKLIFLKYSKLSHKFSTVMCMSMTGMLLTYYFKAVIPSILMAKTNSSSDYQLPYKVKPLIKPTDGKTYAFGCICQLIAIPIVVSGYVGTDCLFTSSGFHLTAQLMILKSRVRGALAEVSSTGSGIRSFVLRHHQLIRLADILEDGFTYIICQQLLGTIFSLCMSGYHALLGLADAQVIKLLIFVVHACGTSSTLFVYCYVGECLIEESTTLCEALYDCNWYELSLVDLKSVQICMMRARKPLQLTSAKFCAISLCTFSDTLKTSMAYLSVLRTVI